MSRRAITATTTPPVGTTWVDRYGQLQVSGNKIVNKNGQPVALMGMSMYWDIWGEEIYWTPGVVNWLTSDWKINTLRAACAVEINDGYGSNGWVYDRAANLALMETVIDAAIANGIYVIADWHTNYAESYLNAALDFFTYFPQKYGSHPNVLWEIYSEPSTGEWEVIRNYALQVTATIRQYSPNLIICGTPYGSWGVDWALANPLPDSNTAYTRHVYANGGVDDGISRTTAALNGGLAVYCTEWGETGPDGGISDPTLNFPESQRWIDFCMTNGIGMNKWSVSDQMPGSASVLKYGASTTGGWNPDTDLTESGIWIRNKIREINLAL